MVYLVDFIGDHCGMHYYLDAFKRILESIDGVKVGIVSNYSDNGEPAVLLNQYKGNKINKVTSALRNMRRLDKFISSHKEDRFIYMSYGNVLDPFFLKIISKAPYHCIDVHEVIAQNEDSNIRLKEKIAKVYANGIQNVISHSSRTNAYLKQFGFEGDRYEVPHFKYMFPRDYDLHNISDDLRKSVNKDKLNILFFGSITKEKGIDIFLEAINSLSPEDAERINFIVAGKDIDGVYKNVALKPDRNVSLFIRHITDDELRFLYENVDFLALPYRSTYQSGILEMALYFKKPIIASDIPYFRKTLTEFPSFGKLSGDTAEDFSASIHDLLSHRPSFFSDEDYSRYENRKEVDEFKIRFRQWLLPGNKRQY